MWELNQSEGKPNKIKKKSPSQPYSQVYSRMSHRSKLQPYGQKLCSTHKYMILCGGISQIDGLEAGKITYEDSSLLVVRKCVKPTFAQQIKW